MKVRIDEYILYVLSDFCHNLFNLMGISPLCRWLIELYQELNVARDEIRNGAKGKDARKMLKSLMN